VKLLDVLRTAALFLVAAGLFAMSYVIHDVMGKHGRYAPVSYEDETVVVMDTHTGRVWSVNSEEKEADIPQNVASVARAGRRIPPRTAEKNTF
jgi:hypothetical protein